MSQQASDLPRPVQIIGRYRTLIGIMAVLGLLAGAVFAALNPPTLTSTALVLVSPCPDGAICGGPLFSPAYIQAELLKAFPSGVQVKPVTGNVLSVSATAGTAARAEAIVDAAARSYISYAGSLSYQGWPASAQMLQPATSATETAPPKQLLGDALLGVVFGTLLGIIAALAGSRTTIDPLAAPHGVDVGEEAGRASREVMHASTGLSLEQLAEEHAKRKADRLSPLGSSNAEPP